MVLEAFISWYNGEGTGPDEYDEIEFGETDEDYEEMLADVRECIKRKISLVELYGMEEG